MRFTRSSVGNDSEFHRAENFLKVLGLFCLVLIAGSSWQTAFAQEEPAEEIEETEEGERFLEPLDPRPADHILDTAGILDPEQKKEILRIIKHAKDTLHVEAYVVTYKVVPDRNANERAQRLRSEWESEKRSMLVLYDRLNHAITFSASEGMGTSWTRLSLQHMMRNAIAESRESLGDEFLDVNKAGDLVTHAVGSMFENKLLRILAMDSESKPVWKDRSALLINSLALLTILTLGVVAIPIIRRLNTKQELDRRRAVFPTVRVPMRLGGIFSGGLSASIPPSSPGQDGAKPPSFHRDRNKPATEEQDKPV